MQGPGNEVYELTEPAAAAARWRDEAKRYQTITDEAREAAVRTWDRGDTRACEVAIRTAESALRWCEACAAMADAWCTVAWAADAEGPEGEGLATYLAAGDAATDAEAIVTLARDALAATMRVRRLTRTVAACEPETICTGAVVE